MTPLITRPHECSYHNLKALYLAFHPIYNKQYCAIPQIISKLCSSLDLIYCKYSNSIKSGLLFCKEQQIIKNPYNTRLIKRFTGEKCNEIS